VSPRRRDDSRLLPEDYGAIINPMKFIVTLGPGEDGFVIAECPALPGCITQGVTKEEALVNVREAIELSLESRKALGLPLEVDTAEVEVAAPD
jgi:predicted RNase H-like HicB family nuclease